MAVHIGEHFTYKNIAKITLFPIVMMVFTSLYCIIDGIFIANFAGGDAFAAINLVWPFIIIIGSIGFMLGAGGTALVSKQLGEGDKAGANRSFSQIVYASLVIGVAFSVGGFFAVKPIVNAMVSITPNTTPEMVHDAILYGRMLMLGQVAFILQNEFQTFFMVAEKNNLGFGFTVLAGVTNMALDAIFIAALRWGVAGAAGATIAGYLMGGVGPIIYFAVKKKGIISLGKPAKDLRILGRACYNGLSEFVGNISASVAGTVYNVQLLKFYGQSGVSAYGVVLYVSFVFASIFIGYSMGMAPPVGYNLGAKNKPELQNILRKSLIVVGLAGLVMAAISFALATPLSKIFSSGDPELQRLCTYAMRVHSIAYLTVGFAIYFSAFFTALGNGTVSAILSLSRTLVMQIAFAFAFPALFGAKGLWWGIAACDVLAALFGVIFLLAKHKKYGYFKTKQPKESMN